MQHITLESIQGVGRTTTMRQWNRRRFDTYRGGHHRHPRSPSRPRRVGNDHRIWPPPDLGVLHRDKDKFGMAQVA